MEKQPCTMQEIISQGKTTLGIELGSTRIKAVLIDDNHMLIASGSHNWENRLENGMWTYSLSDVWAGIQASFAKLCANVHKNCGATLTKVGAIGISAMMHGYLVFDIKDEQLVPFRTWRNTSTQQAASILTEKFQFNIPQRWSIAHLYQAMLNKESHVKDISFLTTLAGYVHWQLTGKKVLGVGDASGVFPIDSETNNYNSKMLGQFNQLTDKDSQLITVLPQVLNAGDAAGMLTAAGAKLLDPTGALQADIPLCPPEGDAGTGMVATNSVAQRTGNVSAGTSIFAMIVLEKALSNLHTEIDMVTTPNGRPVAMVHCNNCTSDLDAWVQLLDEALQTMGAKAEKSALYDALYSKALEGESDCGGLLSFNYYSGEPITGLEEGRPLFTRMPNSRFTLANFARCLLFSAMATLKIGMDILTEQENVRLEEIMGHGGLFKTKGVGQTLMAGALSVPVAVMESAGEGGAWGIALLAAYMLHKTKDEPLDTYLAQKVFKSHSKTSVQPQKENIDGFNIYMKRYAKGLPIERAAIEHLQ